MKKFEHSEILLEGYQPRPYDVHAPTTSQLSGLPGNLIAMYNEAHGTVHTFADLIDSVRAIALRDDWSYFSVSQFSAGAVIYVYFERAAKATGGEK